jgi:hypothetical protein
MEVHHHAHTARKKWTHYFWEFLMLFLAVFCGFMAENKREHMIEHKREKEFMFSMLEDLKSDTSLISKIVGIDSNYIRMTDSLLSELLTDSIKTNSNKAYRLWENSSGFADFYQNDRTIQQLKNSGSLRLIRKKIVSNAIMEYEKAVLHLVDLQHLVDDYLVQTIDNKNRLFARGSLNKHTNNAVPLLSPDRKFLEEMYGFKLDFKNLILDLINRSKSVSAKASGLIESIKKEYHLK